MNLQQLETFRWIARLRSFSRTADKVNATQSTVSMRLVELEKELGVILVERTRRSVKLTPKGRELLRHADDMAAVVAQIRHTVAHAKTLSGSLRVGLSELIAVTWLPKLVQVVKEHYPLIDVELRVGLSAQMLASLQADELDLLLVPVGERPIAGLRVESLGKVRFGFCASAELGVPERPQTPAALSTWPFITQGGGSVMRSMLVQWFGHGGIQPGRIVTANSMETSAMLAAAGLGITYLPIAYYQPWIDDGRIRQVRTRPAIPPTRFGAVFPERRSTPLVEAIVRLAVEHSTFSR